MTPWQRNSFKETEVSWSPEGEKRIVIEPVSLKCEDPVGAVTRAMPKEIRKRSTPLVPSVVKPPHGNRLAIGIIQLIGY